MSLATDKASLRSEYRARRRALTPEEVLLQTRACTDRCRDLLLQRGVTVLASYQALPDELDPGSLHERWWDRGHPVWLPRALPDGHLAWHPVRRGDRLRSGRFRIREPDPEVTPEALLPPDAAVVVPGVAFDDKGGRLGMGGGFYDRFLPHHPGLTIGVGYACQYCRQVPCEPHDQRVRVVILGDRLLVPDGR